MPAPRLFARRKVFSRDSGRRQPAPGRQRCICRPGGDQLLPSAERPRRVAVAGDLSDPQERVRSEFWPDRTHHAGPARRRLAVAAAGRPLHRSQAAALFACLWHGLHALRHLPAAYAPNFLALLAGAALLGLGASIFHPEASRLARLASGGAHGMAQSLFQLGGSFGSSIGPVLAAFIVLPHGQSSLAWFAFVALGRHGHSGHARQLVPQRRSPAPQGAQRDYPGCRAAASRRCGAPSRC